jgi:hypothetical protein
MITRRSALALFAAGVAGSTLPRLTALPNRPAKPGLLVLNARSRAEAPPKSGKVQPIESVLRWKGSETAIIVCDMWDDHCVFGARRVGEMVPRFNQVLAAARENGVAVIHAPSGVVLQGRFAAAG